MNNCTDIKLLRMRGRIQMTHFLCYDHNETQSGCAHRLCVSCAWEKTGKGRKMNCTDINLLRMRGRFLLSNLIKMNNSIACLVSSLYLKKGLVSDTHYSFLGFFSRNRALRSIQPHSQAAPWGQGTGGGKKRSEEILAMRLLCICAEFQQCFYLPLSPPLSPSPSPSPSRCLSPSLSLKVN